MRLRTVRLPVGCCIGVEWVVIPGLPVDDRAAMEGSDDDESIAGFTVHPFVCGDASQLLSTVNPSLSLIDTSDPPPYQEVQFPIHCLSFCDLFRYCS